MRILFATGRPFYPDLFGGAERSMYALLLGLSGLGHTCESLATIDGSSASVRWLRLKRLALGRFGVCPCVTRIVGGMSFKRTHSWTFSEAFMNRVDSFQPDVVITQLGMARQICRWSLERNLRTVVFIRDAEDLGFRRGDRCTLRADFIANSKFISQWAGTVLGVNAPVVYPPICTSEFVMNKEGNHILFINPVREKGLHLAADIARLLPDQKFVFLESWPLTIEQQRELEEEIGRLRNVRFLNRREEVQSIFDLAKLLIVPSSWEEAFGRVIVEAQACGIPVIGRDIGGISEAVGLGGKLIERDVGADGWASTISSVLGNRAEYNGLREKAVNNAHTGPWQTDTAVDAFARVITSPLQTHVATS